MPPKNKLSRLETRLIAASRLFDKWYAGMTKAERLRFWSLPRTEQLATIEQADVYPQIQALIEGH